MGNKNFALISVLVVACLVIAGCTVRTKVISKPRVDQDLHGNQGMLMGTAPPPEARPTERKMLQVEVELPSAAHPKTPRRSDQETWGNLGYVTGEEKPAEVQESAPPVKYGKKETIYTVKSGQTLQDIAGEVYGSSGKWLHIYKANRDRLSSPEKIYPGMKLRIPPLAKSYKK